MTSADPNKTCPLDDILTGLDGKSLTKEELAELFVDSGEKFTGCCIVPGTEKRWPQSHSAQLTLTPEREDGLARHVYLKKILAANLPAKSVAALRRDLASNRNEARFYREFAPILASRGVPLLKATVHERLDVLDISAEEVSNEEETLRSGGVVFLLEYAEGFTQTSPLSAEQAASSLQALARLHAAAWEDRELLRAAAARLHQPAGYWTLQQRGEAETRQMREFWPAYVKAFTPHAPELLSRPEICQLAERLEALTPWISTQLRASADDPFATLVHGDFKAMNVFLPGCDQKGQDAILIDFQWIGVGYGIAEVGMHLFHSVSPAALREGGEAKLVEKYYQMLIEALSPETASAFTVETSWRLYQLGLLDWARMVFSSFFRGASPEAFASKAGNQNVGMVYRNIEASLYFVKRVHECLAFFEDELATQQTECTNKARG